MALKSKSLDLVRPDLPIDAVTNGELVRVNLNVPKSTRTAWKATALKHDLTLSDLINEAMNNYLKTHLNK
jgi:hypothetical protein